MEWPPFEVKRFVNSTVADAWLLANPNVTNAAVYFDNSIAWANPASSKWFVCVCRGREWICGGSSTVTHTRPLFVTFVYLILLISKIYSLKPLNYTYTHL